MKKILLPFVTLCSFSLATFALDELPELKASHGGIVKKTNNAILEVVQEKERTSIYITGHDRKTLTDKKLSLSAIAQINGKEYPLNLSFENDHYSASPANTYLHKEKNFVLMLTISFSGKTDKASFHLSDK